MVGKRYRLVLIEAKECTQEALVQCSVCVVVVDCVVAVFCVVCICVLESGEHSWPGSAIRVLLKPSFELCLGLAGRACRAFNNAPRLDRQCL